MKKFDAIQVGDRAEIKHTVTKDDIEKFATLTGDDNKLHVDKDYAARTSFKEPVAHGMLGASFISTIIGTKLPGDGALWFSQSLEFVRPVRIGDTITVSAEVLSKHNRTESIELQTDVYNQDKQKVITGVAKVRLINQEELSPPVAKEPQAKVALVIGGTGGIGSETCLKLARDGFDIIVHYFKNESKAKEIREQIVELGRKAIVIGADIGSPKQVVELIATAERSFETISTFVNAATVRLASIDFENLEWSDIQKQLDINILGNFNLLKLLVPKMKKQRSGKIIFLSSQAVECLPPTDWLPYVTAKSALQGFAKSLAVEL